MKFVEPRPFADPEAAARKLLDLANAFEPIQDGRIYIEKINGPFLFELKGTPAEYKAGLDRAIENGWLELHESGTFVKFTEAGAALFAQGPLAIFALAAYLKVMRFCARCDNCRWVCQAHPEGPWEGPRACGCVAPGEPCPVCNRVDDDTLPELPEGFIVDIKAKDWD
jgi:hypothetical protein